MAHSPVELRRQNSVASLTNQEGRKKKKDEDTVSRTSLTNLLGRKKKKDDDTVSRTSLTNLMGRKKKKDEDTVSRGSRKYDSLSLSEEVKDKFQGIVSFKRRMSRRMSNIIDYTKKSQLGERRHSESTLTLEKTKFLIASDLAELDNEDYEDEVSSPRGIQRKDLPICWLDQTQVKQNRRQEARENTDLITKLYERVYTRHLARHILSYLSEWDIRAMYEVSDAWRTFLSKDLTKILLLRIQRGSDCL